MHAQLMTIGELARKSETTPRAIRYYERLGLLVPPMRTDSNYRLFDSASEQRLCFISKCRSLGFSLAEITELLRVIDDPEHTCAQVERLTRQHVEIIDAKIQHLMDMRRTLANNLSRCTGKGIPDCAVLDFLRKPA